MRVLLLGGTTEASSLARLLAGDTRFITVLSLAGRTATPAAQPVAVRVGGFGGIAGLVRHLRDEKVDAVIDATHPYADQMSGHAVAASKETGVPLASLVRVPWSEQPGDRWQHVSNTESAAMVLGASPHRVFLGIGRQELPVFAAAPHHHYVARVIDAPPADGLPPHITLVQARGPFDLAAETALLRERRIDLVVSKNSGGEATYAKIEAARALELPVVMIARPDKPAGHVVATPEDAVAWLVHWLDQGVDSRRGV
ncbi:MAG: cobalt-precorrin-6A reductase [Reyranella sp.]|nr:MAG: cobalt-precorrin-6A reductase [Reyranella sp.]